MHRQTSCRCVEPWRWRTRVLFCIQLKFRKCFKKGRCFSEKPFPPHFIIQIQLNSSCFNNFFYTEFLVDGKKTVIYWSISNKIAIVATSMWISLATDQLTSTNLQFFNRTNVKLEVVQSKALFSGSHQDAEVLKRFFTIPDVLMHNSWNRRGGQNAALNLRICHFHEERKG